MFKKFEYKNKLVLITGASSGIGAALAREFARYGAKIALVGRDAQRLASIKTEISDRGVLVHDFVFDLNHVSGVDQLIEDVENHFKQQVDVLVNAAGIAVLGFVNEIPLKEYYQTMTINFFAPLALIKKVLPHMKKRGGQIINISSGVAEKGFPGVSAYCVGKSALNILTESLFLEMTDKNVDVISISPGLVTTPFASKIPIYGDLKETFTKGQGQSADFVAQQIVNASYHRKKKLVLTLRTKMLKHLIYWCPSLLNSILVKASRRSK